MTSGILEDFTTGKEPDDYLDISRKVIQGLGYVDNDLRMMMDHNALTMVYEMSEYLPEAIHLCALLEQLYFSFCYQKTKSFKESDATQNSFLSVLVHAVDRFPPKEGEESLQQMLRLESGNNGNVVNEDAIALWEETEQTLCEQKAVIDSLEIDESEKKKIHLVLPPGGDGSFGPPLDRGIYEMIILKQKGFHYGQSMERRNELKDRMIRLGKICLIAHNNLQQPHGKYSALEIHFRRLFTNIKYIISDMMTQLTDQEDQTMV